MDGMMTADPLDRGATGPAMKSRPSTIRPIANASTVIGQETVDVQHYSDAHLFDRLLHRGQISLRQWKAADRVMRCHYAPSGLEPSVTGSYAPRGWTHGNDLSQSDDSPEPLGAWRAMLAAIPRGEAEALEMACMGRHPGMRLPALQGALDRLAGEWGIEDE